MKRVVTFASARCGTSKNARVVLPTAFVEILGLNEQDRDINVTIEGKRIIIEKLEKEVEN